MADYMDNRPVLKALLREKGVKTAGKPIKYISPSHLSLFEMCPRRWYYQYILGIKPPQGAGAGFGHKAHEHVERYLTEGIPVPWDTDEGAAALAGIDHWPSRDDVLAGKVLVEKEILVYRNAIPVPYYGLVDLLRMDEAAVDDHKFSSDPSKWGATAEQLRYDFQGIIYSAGALSIGAKARVDPRTNKEYVRFGHLQYRSKAPHKMIPVRVQMPVDHIKKELDGVDKIVLEMLQVAQIADLEKTPYKEGANSCDKYGREGCFYREVCSVLGVQRAIQEPTAKAMAKINYGGLSMEGVLARLRRSQAAANPEAASAPAAINPPDGFPADVPIPPADLRVAEPNEAAAAEGARIEQEKAAAKEAAKAEKEAAKAERPSSVRLPGRSRAAAPAPAAEEKPAVKEEPKAAPVVEQTPDEDPAVAAAQAAVVAAGNKLEECVALLEEAENSQDTDEIETANFNVGAARKRLAKAQAALEAARQEAAEAAARRAAEAAEAEAKKKAAEEAAREAGKRAATQETKPLGAALVEKIVESSQDIGEHQCYIQTKQKTFLYLNCSPKRTKAVMWEDFIKPIAARIEQATNTPFWRLRGHDAQSILVQEMRVMLADGSLELPAHLSIQPYGGNHVQVTEFLIPLYGEVIAS